MLATEQTVNKHEYLRKIESEALALRRELDVEKRQDFVVPLTDDHLSNPKFNPNNLLDVLQVYFKVRNDSKLAAALRLGRAPISKLRHGRISLTSGVLLRMHDVSGLPINELRQLAGIESPTFK